MAKLYTHNLTTEIGARSLLNLRIYHLSPQKWETRFTLKELDLHFHEIPPKCRN